MKCFVAITCLLALIVSTRASGDGLLGASIHAPNDYYSYPSYAYENTVRDPHTGDNKAYWERRDGELVIGGYSFVEPGGSIRVVGYRADENGFHNTLLTRIGPKVHPGGATSTTEISVPAGPIPRHAAPLPIHPVVYNYRPSLPLPYTHGWGHGHLGYY
ncbi:cuticle protein 19-like [Zerene cesonia]|uniref:cuticle protein 19-like n=1 Tax=Zerene cesonia TaxID=33412 RepID=UPI0018E59B7D|nr:cuticle protein 19-like [Zerene cesonia]